MISIDTVHVSSLKQAWETVQPDYLKARLTLAIMPFPHAYLETRKSVTVYLTPYGTNCSIENGR